MGDLIDISSHPDYTNPELKLAGELLAFEAFAQDCHDQGENPWGGPSDRPAAKMDICTQCTHSIDRRPKWKQWLARYLPLPLAPSDLICAAFPLIETTHPVTGETAYVMGSLLDSEALSEGHEGPFEACEFNNFCGSCRSYDARPDPGF